MTEISLKQVKAKIKGLEAETAKAVVCALVGHSKIQTFCFGYFNCSRCDAQVGDTLAGSYDPSHVVVVGHNCDKCQKNFKACTWKDTFMAPDPFAEAAE